MKKYNYLPQAKPNDPKRGILLLRLPAFSLSFFYKWIHPHSSSSYKHHRERCYRVLSHGFEDTWYNDFEAAMQIWVWTLSGWKTTWETNICCLELCNGKKTGYSYHSLYTCILKNDSEKSLHHSYWWTSLVPVKCSQLQIQFLWHSSWTQGQNAAFWKQESVFWSKEAICSPHDLHQSVFRLGTSMFLFLACCCHGYSTYSCKGAAFISWGSKVLWK